MGEALGERVEIVRIGRPAAVAAVRLGHTADIVPAMVVAVRAASVAHPFLSFGATPRRVSNAKGLRRGLLPDNAAALTTSPGCLTSTPTSVPLSLPRSA